MAANDPAGSRFGNSAANLSGLRLSRTAARELTFVKPGAPTPPGGSTVRSRIRNAVALGAIGLLTAACGASAAPASRPSPKATSPAAASRASSAGRFLGCLVTDTGGIDDRSVNASSWQGMQQARAAEPGKITVRYLPSASGSDYTPNINTFIGEKCGIIVTVGLLMGGNTQAAAQSHPDQKFAIVDYDYSPPIKNIDALMFNTAQDGFLGGYLAAGISKSGAVGTFGAEELPTVTIYMDGFWDGVQYYNRQHHTSVRVLGWNEQTHTGLFSGNFTDQATGQTEAQTLISEGADVIFPVAGDAGLGAAKAVQDADAAAGRTKVMMEWAGTDGCFSAPQYCKYFVSSVAQGIQAAVKNAVLSAADGTFSGGNYVGDLANGGVALSSFHNSARQVPASLRSELLAIKAEIISGQIKPATRSPM
jgi:basic membrane protein A and related proteins